MGMGTSKPSCLIQSIINSDDVPTRVRIAHYKIYRHDLKEEGFQELLDLKQHKEAYYPLGCYYYHQSDHKHALFWLKKCNDSMSKYRIACIYAKQPEKHLYWMYESAYLDNKYAQFMLGFYHQHGILVKQSTMEAKTWYQRSANKEFAEAQTCLANLLLLSKDNDGAIHWLRKAEYQENSTAFVRLGLLHEQGILVQGENNRKSAMEYYTKATRVPFATNYTKSIAYYLVGINYRLGDLGLERDDTLALRYLTLSANLGYASAQRALGLMYAQGIGTRQDFSKARILFKSAIKQGDIRSLRLLADVTSTWVKRPFSLYRKAAQAGSIAAQVTCGLILQDLKEYSAAYSWFEMASLSSISISSFSSKSTPVHGKPVQNYFSFDAQVAQRNTARLMVARYRYNGLGGAKQDPSWAFQEFKALTDDEQFPDAYYWLAAYYEEVEKDVDLALYYYKQGAIIANDIDCQFQLGYILSNGYRNKERQKKKDVKEALMWYMKAANQGHATAQYSVGFYHENGICIDADIQEAIRWYQLASENNVTLAMVRLARLLEDTRQAVHWLKKAIAIGDIIALRELATFYKNGLIEHENAELQSFTLYEKAADLDDAMSWHALSEFYEQGHVVNKSVEKAIECMKKAENLGYSVAGLDLAETYYRYHSIQEAWQVYYRLTVTYTINTLIGWTARLEMAKIILLDQHKEATSSDHFCIFSWLTKMQQSIKVTTYPNRALLYEALGYFTEFGIGTTVDKKQSIQWYQACVDETGDEASIQRSLCRLVDVAMEKKEYTTAHTHLNRLSPHLATMSNSSQVCRMRYYLGYLYMNGLGVEKNEDLAIDYYMDAADGGHLDATFELGKALLSIDEEEAKHRLEEGSMEEHAGCMRVLAILLIAEESDQTAQDEDDDYDAAAEILRLLETAAELQDVEATYQLALVYEKGIGTIEKNPSKALEMYIKATELGHELSMVKASEILGTMTGKQTEAIYWLQKAVKKSNNIKAKVMLISYNFQGYTVEKYDDAHNYSLLLDLVENPTALSDQQVDHSYSVQEREDKLSMDQSGLGLACYILGQCNEIGRGTSPNMNKAKEWYKKSVQLSNHIESMWRLGYIYGVVEENDYAALSWYRKAAEQGHHRESQYQLGLFHLHGLGGLEKNRIAAQKYFSKASNQGHSPATFELARLVWNHNCIYGYELYKVAAQLQVSGALRELGHLSHTGYASQGVSIVEQDHKRAFAYYCEAAQMGDPTAALMVGNYFEEGYLLDDLGQDCERALQWYESAYRLNGGTLAELAIGKLKHTLADTIVDTKDAEDMREEAFVWFESAASNANDPVQSAFAKIMVALYHLNGWGRKVQDAKVGFEMLVKIAESGNHFAFVSLARCYEEGIGTEPDIEKAMYYWELAGKMDDPGALVRVGEIYELGLSGQINKETAEVYYHKAHMLGL